jgi:hypothetical protein
MKKEMKNRSETETETERQQPGLYKEDVDEAKKSPH